MSRNFIETTTATTSKHIASPISNSQQTDITNNTIETNNQTTNYIDNNYLNNDKIATVVLNPTPSLNENYLWIPETTDNVVPGLDSLLAYLQSKFATINALQNAMNNVNNTIYNNIVNIQTEINYLEVNTPQTVNKNLSYHTNHTDFMYQKIILIIIMTIEDSLFYNSIISHINEKVRNQELQIQLLSNIVADLQNQINNITSNGSSGGSDPNEPEVGTM